MSVEDNKKTIKRFFHEGLDKDDQAFVQTLFVDGGQRHYPGRTVQMKAGQSPPKRRATEFWTEIHHLFGEGDNVVARITHHVTYEQGAEWTCQMGTFSCEGKSVAWDATVIFRFQDGKIAEEWVNRDELGVVRQIGVVDK